MTFFFVGRFQAIWDDDSLEYAEKTLYTISYFLENNTIEIKEIRPPNSGKEGPTKIMARRKVPKCVREIQGNRLLILYTSI